MARSYIFLFASEARSYRIAHSGGPPDSAGALVGYHAGADRLARGAGAAVQNAFIGVDLAEYDPCAVTAGRHFPGPLAVLVGIDFKTQTRVVFCVGGLQRETRRRDDAHPAPVGVGHVQNLFQYELCGGVAAWLSHVRITVVQERFFFDHLAQHRVHGRQQAFGLKTRDCRWNTVVPGNELPFLGPHDGGYMARRDQGVEPGRLAFQQHGHRRPGQAPGQQDAQIG